MQFSDFQILDDWPKTLIWFNTDSGDPEGVFKDSAWPDLPENSDCLMAVSVLPLE